MLFFDEMILKSLVCLNIEDCESKQVLERLIDVAVAEGVIAADCKDETLQAVMMREQISSTALPDGIALPHGRSECVSEITCVLGIHPEGIDFGAPDHDVTRIFVMLLVPKNVGCRHIHFLANLSRRLMERSTRERMINAKTRNEVLEALVDTPLEA